ncbi:hypothetical protein Tco_0683192 [Tanacetum coccineum]|uniref:Uncharacterized protein n=1 Tax=Tanacetum coccineum TaxID=301880 RepID=A0ABQ4XTE7_9ASTR
MAKQVELNKQKGKGTGQGENRPVWNNVQRLNHQNKFVPKAVLTKTGEISVMIFFLRRQNLSSQAAATSTARKVNTARPIVNEIRPRNNFYKSHSSIRRPFNRTTTPKANFTNHKVNTAEYKTVSVVEGNRETVVKASTCYDPQKALKNKRVVDSRCSRHMTRNKAYLVEYHDYNVAKFALEEVKSKKLVLARPKLDCRAKVSTAGLPLEKILLGLQNIPAPLDNLPIPVLSKKVFTNMTRRGLHFSGHVTPLFPTMLVPAAVEEGEGSGTHTEPQPTPSPTQPSVGDQTHVTESSSRPENTQNSRNTLEGTGRSEGDQVQLPHDSPLSGGHTSDRAEGGLNLEELFVLCTNLSNRVLALETSKDAQAAEILKLKTRIKKLEKKCKPSISHHRAWLRSVSILSMKKKLGKKESVSKQGRKNAKPGPTLDDSAFDNLDADLAHGMDYMDTEEAVNEGRQSKETEELNVTHDTELKKSQEEKAAQEEASRTAIMEMIDEVQAAAQRKFKAAQRAVEIRSRPPTKAQLRNLMMTYLKNMGGYKHSQLKAKTFEEIQGMYERQKKKIDDFKPMDSDDVVKDNKKAAGEDTLKKEEVLKESDSTKVKVKLEEAEPGIKKTPGKIVKMKVRKKARKQTHADTDNEHDFEEDERNIKSMNKEDAGESSEKVSDISKKRKGGPRMKRQSKRKKTYSGLEEEGHLKNFLKIVPNEEGIIDFEVLEKRFPIINWGSKFYHYDRHGAEGVSITGSLDLMEALDGLKPFLKWTMFDANAEDELWQNQERWNLKSWNFYENCRVHTLTLEDGTEIYMLAERKYPLTKETLERMMSLKLITESASDSTYDLLRLIQKQIDKAGSHDGGETDL